MDKKLNELFDEIFDSIFGKATDAMEKAKEEVLKEVKPIDKSKMNYDKQDETTMKLMSAIVQHSEFKCALNNMNSQIANIEVAAKMIELLDDVEIDVYNVISMTLEDIANVKGYPFKIVITKR